MISLTIAANGQLTLGRNELHALGLQPGDTVELDHLPGGELVLKPVKPAHAQKAIKGKIKTLSGMDAFIHSLDGKVRLKEPLTIEKINAIIAAGWAGELKSE